MYYRKLNNRITCTFDLARTNYALKTAYYTFECSKIQLKIIQNQDYVQEPELELKVYWSIQNIPC